MQFIIMGSWCEYMAHLHVEAETEEEALKVYEKTFTEEQRGALSVNVCNLEKRPDMKVYWKHNGHSVFSGGYNYDTCLCDGGKKKEYCRLCYSYHTSDMKECPCCCDMCGGEKDVLGNCANYCQAPDPTDTDVQ